MAFTFKKHERLKSKKSIETLFKQGKTINSFPLKLLYLQLEEKNSKSKATVSVSKKKFKKAVDRNRIKRLLREAYRLHNPVLFNNNSTSYAFMILYLGNDLPTYNEVASKTVALFKKFLIKEGLK